MAIVLGENEGRFPLFKRVDLVCWLHKRQIEALCPSDFSKWNTNVLAVSEWSVLNQIGFSEIILSDFIEFNVNYNCAIFHMQIHIFSQK